MAEVFYFHVQEDRSIKYKLPEPIMQEDKDVATWRFRIPKVLNNIDMSAWAWWFVYVNARGQKFSELLTLNNDIDDPENFSTADYPIGYGISKTPGGFTFALEAISAEQGGEISGEWHTRTYTHTVTPTLQGNQAEYAETESDIISALMQEVRTRMNQVIGGATPLPVNLKSLMTDHDKVYLYTGSENGESTGYWYYWNGTDFVPGGVYGAGDPESVQGYVEDWLNEHPEATTTVQDGSITREKFTDSLNKKIDSIYDTAQDMIQDTSLVSGMFVQTGGHESVHDGGGQLYRITSTKPSAQSSADVPAEVYETLTNGLYAERVRGFDVTKFSISDKLGNSYSGNFVNNSSVITELLNVCSSYEDNGDKLYYGHYSALDYGDHDVSNGENDGKYQIDCSAFVQLVLAGISFDSSRYNVNDNYFVSQYSFFPYRTKAEYQNQNTFAKYRLSDCQAKYAYENGYSFLPNWDWSNVQAGDVVYLQDGDIESSNWGGVDHVMIYIGRRNNTDDLAFYECGGNGDHRKSVSSANIVHVRVSTLAFMNTNTKLVARFPLGIGTGNTNCVIYEDKHPDFPVTFSAGARSAAYEIEPISTGEWYTVIAKIKSLQSNPFYITDAGHTMVCPGIDGSGIYVNTFRSITDFSAFRIGSYQSTDSDIVFEDFKIVKGFGNSLNVPYKKPTRVKKVDTITVDYQNATANAWEYVGLSITVPAGHRYLVRCTQGWNSGKPIGMALHTATSGMLTYTHESANDAVMGTPMYMLDSGTWYLFTKRATVATAANVYAVTILDVDLN